MKTITKFVGLDVSKENIAVAVADEGRGEPRFIGMLPHTVEAVRSLVHRLASDGVELEFCYEAGLTGYGLYRLLRAALTPVDWTNAPDIELFRSLFTAFAHQS
ncbi:IS110 family transposase [Alicyclobacillus sp. TC]|uniref:Transposase n=1 Tax=Alicyclobacillus tolerans TaxID=90970 RepID=A0ABT9LZV5_9BACL|nr:MULTISPECIES: hypothetical protein [Alicyclobacillus]MDP9729805.1 transposase [Alicyclobacillus tengchongensis]QRF23534.1 IS110 family transposase [Alicyclobacillus sp. TC]